MLWIMNAVKNFYLYHNKCASDVYALVIMQLLMKTIYIKHINIYLK